MKVFRRDFVVLISIVLFLGALIIFADQKFERKYLSEQKLMDSDKPDNSSAEYVAQKESPLFGNPIEVGVSEISEGDIDRGDLMADGDLYNRFQEQLGYFDNKTLMVYQTYSDEVLSALAASGDKVALKLKAEKALENGDIKLARNYAISLAKLGSTQILPMLAILEEPLPSERLGQNFTNQVVKSLAYYDLMAAKGDIQGLEFGISLIKQLNVVLDKETVDAIFKQSIIYNEQIFEGSSFEDRQYDLNFKEIDYLKMRVDAFTKIYDVNISSWSKIRYQKFTSEFLESSN